MLLIAMFVINIFPNLIRVFISYINQQMITFLKQVHTFTREDPILYQYFFCLNNPRM